MGHLFHWSLTASKTKEKSNETTRLLASEIYPKMKADPVPDDACYISCRALCSQHVPNAVNVPNSERDLPSQLTLVTANLKQNHREMRKAGNVCCGRAELSVRVKLPCCLWKARRKAGIMGRGRWRAMETMHGQGKGLTASYQITPQLFKDNNTQYETT